MRRDPREEMQEAEWAKQKKKVRPATSSEVLETYFCLLIAIAVCTILLASQNKEILRELCSMNYPECVLGVDR